MELIESIMSGDFLYDKVIIPKEVKRVVDPQNGIWDLGTKPRCPCACHAEFWRTGQIFLWYCPSHSNVGFLIFALAGSRWWWLNPKRKNSEEVIFMNKDLKKVLTDWDVLRYTDLDLKEVRHFIDGGGGFWNLSQQNGPIGPCGCVLKVVATPYRRFWHCEKHPEGGILVDNYKDGKLYWLSGKL